MTHYCKFAIYVKCANDTGLKVKHLRFRQVRKRTDLKNDQLKILTKFYSRCLQTALKTLCMVCGKQVVKCPSFMTNTSPSEVILRDE